MHLAPMSELLTAQLNKLRQSMHHNLWEDKCIVPFVSGNNTNADAGAGLPHDKTLTVSSPNYSQDQLHATMKSVK